MNNQKKILELLSQAMMTTLVNVRMTSVISASSLSNQCVDQCQQDVGWDKVSFVGVLLWSLFTVLGYISKIVWGAVAVGKQMCQILTTDPYFACPILF